MKTKGISFYERRATIAKALGHPSRLMIVDALQEKERCVCELTDLVGADQSTVSRHLSVLKNAGLVDTRKEGPMIYYRLRVKCLEGFFTCIEAVLRENLHREEALVQF
jgi:ArsR family transcriptional regulator